MLSRFEWPLEQVQFISDIDSNRRNEVDEAINNIKRRLNSKNMEFKR